MVDGRQKNNRHKLKQKRFTLDNRKLLHNEEMRRAEQWKWLPREDAHSPCLEAFRSKLDKAPSGLTSYLPLLWAGGWPETSCSAFQPDLLYDPPFPTMLKARGFWGKWESNQVYELVEKKKEWWEIFPCHSSRWPLCSFICNILDIVYYESKQFTV